ncbi:MAG TPA: Hsp20 family protein, partial [Nitrospiraceae bacterium]|nr:Hsp20 family protein [Nitrospiraceae bacterium]
SDNKTYLHRGIAARPFLRQFDLADYVEVTGATMGDGLLVVDLKRELPEELKPRRIPINAGMFMPVGRRSPSQIERNTGDHVAG